MYFTLLHDKRRCDGSKARLARAAALVALSVFGAGAGRVPTRGVTRREQAAREARPTLRRSERAACGGH